MNDADVLVSIVIPARNAASTIGDALDSLQRQTHRQWEALVVDDASTDDTASIVGAHAVGDPRIRLLAGSGNGASSARNIAIAEARGVLMLFLDADDWIAPHHLSVLVAALHGKPDADAAYGRCTRVLPDGRILPPAGDDKMSEAPAAVILRGTAVPIHAVLVRTEAVIEVGGFDPSLATCEDWDLWQRIVRGGGGWAFVPDALCFYRMSERSLSRNLRTVLVDAATVIERGFSRDSRVTTAAPEMIDGLAGPDSPTAAEILREVAYWFAAVSLRDREDFAPVPTFLSGRAGSVDAQSIALAETIVHGVAYGLAIEPSALAEHWPDYGARLVALIDALGGGDPVAARRLLYRVERAILDLSELRVPQTLRLTHGRVLDIGGVLSPPRLPESVDRLYLRVAYGRWKGTGIDLGVLGPMPRRTLAGVLVDFYGPTSTGFAALLRFSHRGASMWLDYLRRASRYLQRKEVSGPASTRSKSHSATLAKLRRRATALNAGSALEQTGPARNRGADWEGTSHDKRKAADWDHIFLKADPWNYASAYEQEKYERQLRLLPDVPIAKAVELACAEGHFSRQLSPLVGHLLATDISTAALARARDRCADRTNIDFEPLDLVADPFPQAVDLIVCSEVLYYLPGTDELRDLCKRMAAALNHGGHLLTAHSFVVADSRQQTCFDWPNAFGAATISATLSATPGLILVRSLETELYRIDLHVHRADQTGVPETETAVGTTELEAEVARCVIPGGPIITRSEAAKHEHAAEIPVLMYHRIAEDGPDALSRYRVSPAQFREQLTWLRRNGYHTINSGELEWYIRNRHPIAGRPLLITFDDAYQDFSTTAWPLLRSFDFYPEVFVVTELAGSRSEWDSAQGGAFPLMDATTVARLYGEGVSFGSHLATHSRADGLSTGELVDELLQSRATLATWIGKAPNSLAPPHGATDLRLRRLARECGYSVAFSTRPGLAKLDADPFDLPRIEVHDDMTLEAFSARIRRR